MIIAQNYLIYPIYYEHKSRFIFVQIGDNIVQNLGIDLPIPLNSINNRKITYVYQSNKRNDDQETNSLLRVRIINS